MGDCGADAEAGAFFLCYSIPQFRNSQPSHLVGHDGVLDDPRDVGHLVGRGVDGEGLGAGVGRDKEQEQHGERRRRRRRRRRVAIALSLAALPAQPGPPPGVHHCYLTDFECLEYCSTCLKGDKKGSVSDLRGDGRLLARQKGNETAAAAFHCIGVAFEGDLCLL